MEKTVFVVTPEVFAEFLKMLDAEPEPNQALAELFSRPTVFDKTS